MRQLGLRLHSWLGWGQHPNELRVRSTVIVRVIKLGFIPFALFIPLVVAAIAVPSYVEQHHSLSHFPLVSLIRFILSLEVLLWLAGIVFFALPAVTSWGLAQRGAAGRMGRVYGRCFATLLDPPGRMFAHIGASREAARWYSLPLE